MKQRREALREEARKESLPINPIEWELARWTILLTNCKGEGLSVEEALGLQQARWACSRRVGRWSYCTDKTPQEPGADRQMAQQPSMAHTMRVVCQTDRFVQVLQHWLLVIGCWANPARSLWSLWSLWKGQQKGQQMLQRWGWALALAR